jgi:hypothetical protein
MTLLLYAERNSAYFRYAAGSISFGFAQNKG